jgi:hypothetical protein
MLAKITGLNEEYEKGDKTSARVIEKRERILSGFSCCLADAMKVFVLFSEI